jgi:hypothetical protein
MLSALPSNVNAVVRRPSSNLTAPVFRSDVMPSPRRWRYFGLVGTSGVGTELDQRVSTVLSAVVPLHQIVVGVEVERLPRDQQGEGLVLSCEIGKQAAAGGRVFEEVVGSVEAQRR